MRRILAKVIIIYLIYYLLFWNNAGLYVDALEINEIMSTSQGSIQIIDSTVSESVYTDQSDNDVLTLDIVTKNNTFKIIGESSAESVAITIKDSNFIVVKQVSANVISGRFEWSDSLSNYIPGETYKTIAIDNNGNTTSHAITLEDNYTLNLSVLTSGKTFTVAGESSCTEVNISIKNSKFVEVENTMIDVNNGRFEWSGSISRFTPEANYSVKVTDTKGHTTSDTVIIPVKDDIYTLTVSVSTKDGELKIVGESSAKSVKINIKDANLRDVFKGSESVKNGRYIWSQSLSKYKEDETYKVIITDKDEHTVTEQMTIPISVKSIEFGDFEKKLEVGKSLSLTTTVMPTKAQDQTVKYFSSNENVATVSSSGKVTSHSAGPVIITASSGNASADAELTVYIKTIKIKLNENFLTLLPNKTFQISTLVLPKTAEQKCTYTSTNENVIIADASGVITAKNPGVASVIVSNGDASEIITAVVNNDSDRELGGSLSSYSNYNAETENIKNSQLASMIQNNASKEIVLNNTDLSLLDSSTLCMLKNENKNLIIEKGKYLILIQGRAIANPANTFLLDIPIEYVEDNMKFVVNDGQPLPGKITINLRDDGVFTKKYLYLYNQSKNKYEKIDSFNADDKSIYIDKGGTYLLTEKKLSQFPINWLVAAVAGGICVVFGSVYVVIKRRYWFY
ncbi:Ig-like domain (group 2) [Desulfotomaculum arcticum]|uniref:Ig-like domain (Group 2) n=1 Tax=Desulfotruncus arcticus DSM 17038 TaxID=1121424 RepID=A0A1I2WP31_9FIRM|nr:Ig-like domain-containing protein [Desulfotruncus arcticus]SFH02126.1 Ig-like domain (group 2) [Desulfotomaculum arcticum] [Desulfotruncus arcticus DSM 17038]